MRHQPLTKLMKKTQLFFTTAFAHKVGSAKGCQHSNASAKRSGIDVITATVAAGEDERCGNIFTISVSFIITVFPTQQAGLGGSTKSHHKDDSDC